MAELYRKVAPFRHEMEPVGYTEDDVRRLARAYMEEMKWAADVHAPLAHTVLAPFRALLDGDKPNG